MSWILLIVVTLALGVALLVTLARRNELARMAGVVQTRRKVVAHGADEAKLHHPVIDLTRCLGCATCVAVCPEEDVLEIVHGQAMVVNGARCQGIRACERECPVGAVEVTLANLEQRRDVPALTDELEAIGSPGVFLAGEVTAHALIRTAIEHGTAVAAEVGRRLREEPPPALPAAGGEEPVLDLCIVGAGPAGLACSLEAKRLGLSFAVLDQESWVGGTVAKYPRRKLVLTQPLELPIYGGSQRTEYTKEELIELWQGIVEEQQLPIHGGQVFEACERSPDGHYVVRTSSGAFAARHVCLALGRRGVPRKLGVPGEELGKVAFSLLDANSYQGRRVLVVGGGDSAVEAAVGLAEQPGNEVTLSYRKDGFYRVAASNEKRLERAVGEGRLSVLFGSEVRSIGPASVDMEVANGAGPQALELPNDDVFVMAGGVAPVESLERSGVSFDPALREVPEPLLEQGTGLVRALKIGFVLALATLAFALVHRDYYGLQLALRPTHPKHVLLRPGLGLGLVFGLVSMALVAVNLLYLARRSPRTKLRFGSLQAWMTSHVATGILAVLAALLHGAMAPENTAGGHAFLGLGVLLVTGAIGRYFYAYVPRAANGRELALEEVQARLAKASAGWDQGQQHFGERAREAVQRGIEEQQWKSSFLGRVLALALGQRALRRTLAELEREGRASGLAEDQLRETLDLARQAQRTALMAAHYEDLRAVLGTWRFLHRWVAALTVLLIVVHVVFALIFGSFFSGGSR